MAPDLIWVEDQPEQIFIRIEYTPTVPHCSLATLIGTRAAELAAPLTRTRA